MGAVMPFDEAVKAYRGLVEENPDGALTLLVVNIVDSDEGYVFALQIDGDHRPGDYIRLVGRKLADEGKEVSQIILHAESWIHIKDLNSGSTTGLDECAALMMRNRDGEERSVIIPFTRMGDGAVHWRELQEQDMAEVDGEVIDALREVVVA